MVKNKLEKLFSESMHSDTRLWGMKLISNPLTHQNTPADYILDYQIIHPDLIHQSITVRELIIALVECKHVDCDDGEGGRLAFKRLKQMHDLINFENVRDNTHRAFFCIAFHETRWDKSEVYMIPVHQMQRFVHESSKVSMNRDEARATFHMYRVKMKGPLLDLSILYS